MENSLISYIALKGVEKYHYTHITNRTNIFSITPFTIYPKRLIYLVIITYWTQVKMKRGNRKGNYLISPLYSPIPSSTFPLWLLYTHPPFPFLKYSFILPSACTFGKIPFNTTSFLTFVVDFFGMSMINVQEMQYYTKMLMN